MADTQNPTPTPAPDPKELAALFGLKVEEMDLSILKKRTGWQKFYSGARDAAAFTGAAAGGTALVLSVMALRACNKEE